MSRHYASHFACDAAYYTTICIFHVGFKLIHSIYLPKLYYDLTAIYGANTEIMLTIEQTDVTLISEILDGAAKQ